jgi:hypothetical protein
MAYIPQLVDMGVCLCCMGDGWAIPLTGEHPIINSTRRKPQTFDIGKCAKCGGTGRIYKVF